MSRRASVIRIECVNDDPTDFLVSELGGFRERIESSEKITNENEKKRVQDDIKANMRAFIEGLSTLQQEINQTLNKGMIKNTIPVLVSCIGSCCLRYYGDVHMVYLIGIVLAGFGMIDTDKAGSAHRMRLNLEELESGDILDVLKNNIERLEKPWVCPICYDDKPLKDKIWLNVCGHAFHKKCIVQVRNKKCPMCQQDIYNTARFMDDSFSENIYRDEDGVYNQAFLIKPPAKLKYEFKSRTKKSKSKKSKSKTKKSKTKTKKSKSKKSKTKKSHRK